MADALKLPPQNTEAEQSVLGSILLDKDALVKIADILKPTDFYDARHGMIYEAMLTLFEKNKPVDAVTVAAALENGKKLETTGGATYLAELTVGVPTTANVAHYAEIVQNKATLRRLISAASRISELGYKEEENLAEVIDQAESNLFAVSQHFQHERFILIKDILADTFDRIDELHKNRGELRGVSTGFVELDNLLAGLQPSDLIVLAARPSMGKTSLALSFALHAAVEKKVHVALFSLEMSKEQLVDRFLSSEAGVDSWKIRTGNLSEEDFPRLNWAMGKLAEAPLFIDDSPTLNVMEIRTKARRLQMERGLGMVIVDYLQLIAGPRGNFSEDNRVQEVSAVSRALKALARELNVPVLAISQLSRAVESRPSKVPQLSDLRESGSIEQDADVVMFIYREDYYEKDTERKNVADILIKKHRNGPTGGIELYFIPEQMRFRTIEKAHLPQPQAAVDEVD